jgi:peptidoglycan hydrolase-like protein with peptidoglycan-binding domain
MKNYAGRIAAGVASTFIMAAPFAAGALSIDDIQSQIAALLRQVSALQEQIKALQNTQTTPPQEEGIWIPKHRICALLNRNLNVGISGDDVKGLQEFLAEQGYLTASATGYFGQLTAQAVARWQASEGVSAVGSFGPLSRERLKAWCGGGGAPNKERFSASPTRGEAPLTVLFETWLSGFRVNTVSYVIDYGDGTSERAADCPAPADACVSPGQNKHTYAANGTYTATLNKITHNCPEGAQCNVAPITEVLAKVKIQVGPVACTKEYVPVCGAKQVQCVTTPCNPIPMTYGNKCEMEADGAKFLYSGQCKEPNKDPANDPQCKVWSDGCNTCSRSTPGGPGMCTLMACMTIGDQPRTAYCKEYFGSSTNKPPVISGLSGPTTLAVNASGTWTIKASDPEGGQLSYRVLWGDESIYGTGLNTAGASQDFVQSTTFTHAYSSPGTYTVIVVVQDSVGQQAKTSTTVKVNSGDIVCTQEYAPVCGQPKWTCPTGMMCNTVMPAPKTYSNRCLMNAEGASFLYSGQCTDTGATY